ncbi:MAG: hypothetical protein JNM24_00060 [Bdellovibrionaceae bacterium]|nr:hypothetical protein [Pseudobdellovibrionaceae bacterium]
MKMNIRGFFVYFLSGLAFLISGCVMDSRISSLSEVTAQINENVVVKVEGSIQTVVLTEGLTTNVNFTLSRPLSQDLLLKYELVSSRGDQNSDLLSTSGTVTIPAGFAGFTFGIQALSDGIYDGDESFDLIFTPLTVGLGLEKQTLPVRIIDNDLPPMISMMASTALVLESVGTSTITVQLNRASQKPISVAYNFAEGTALGAGIDYSGVNGTVSFAAGETLKTIPYTVINDSTNEVSESLTVSLGAITGDASLGSIGTTVVTITDNDAAPTLSINSPSISEGTGAGTTTLIFTVTLSAASGQTITANYATASGTATSGTDFTAANGTLIFSPGETSKTITVTITRESLSESAETFTVTLSGATNITTSGSTLVGTGTISDDDTLPTLSISSATINEAVGTASRTVTLSAASGQTVTFSWATADGTATSSADYTSSSGIVTIAAGTISTTISVPIFDDSVSESTETFTITLSSPSNATIASGTATLSIADNDVVWLGSSGDGKWSTPSNWSKGSVPTSSDVVTFDNTCTTNCNASIDIAADVAGLNLLGTYSGTITQTTHALTVRSKGFTMASGIFSGGSAGIAVVGTALTITGGTFTSTTGTLQIINPAVGYNTGNALVVSVANSFNHNNGLIWFNFGSSNYPTGLVNVASGNSFNNVLLRCTSCTDDMVLSSEGTAVTPTILGTFTLRTGPSACGWGRGITF